LHSFFFIREAIPLCIHNGTTVGINGGFKKPARRNNSLIRFFSNIA
jgi:hypothetical protein